MVCLSELHTLRRFNSMCCCFGCRCRCFIIVDNDAASKCKSAALLMQQFCIGLCLIHHGLLNQNQNQTLERCTFNHRVFVVAAAAAACFLPAKTVREWLRASKRLLCSGRPWDAKRPKSDQRPATATATAANELRKSNRNTTHFGLRTHNTICLVCLPTLCLLLFPLAHAPLARIHNRTQANKATSIPHSPAQSPHPQLTIANALQQLTIELAQQSDESAKSANTHTR